MEINNEQIYAKLEEIHKLLKLVQKEEEQIMEEEFKVEIEEEKLMNILGKEINREFDNLLDWRNYVWESCEFKKANSDDQKIDFICKKTNKSCRFEDCFKNKVK